MQSNTFDEALDATGLRFAIAVSRFNSSITEKLLEGALEGLRQAGVEEDNIRVEHVPGAWELPLLARVFALGESFDAVICLGAVIRGDTPHFDYVAGECARGLQQVQVEAGCPVVFGVLTTDNMQQALERVGGAHGHKGRDAAMTAIEMALLLSRLESGN